MKISKGLLSLLLFQYCIGVAISQDATGPLPGHAHNDYEHERPLFDALQNGFRSIEADVYSIGDSLYVAHLRKEIKPGRTLRALYLEPLKAYFLEQGHTIYDGDNPLILLIDIKDDGLDTYKLLDHILNDFRDMLCQVSPEGYVPGEVMLVVSGNRPYEYMMQQTVRLAFLEGRVDDLGETYSSVLMPLISDRWPKHFSWKGKGEMPEKEKAKLHLYLQQAHDNGQLVRFWATPDKAGKERDTLWTELLDAGVDLINTDDLTGLREFLK